MKRRWSKGGKASATLAMAAAATLVPARAEAHVIGLSTGEYAARGESVEVKLAFARAEVARLLPDLDANRDGHVTAFEVESARRALERSVLGRVRVTAGGATCPGVLTAAALSEQDGLSLEGRFDCASRVAPFEVELTLLEDLGAAHRHVARAVGATTHDEVLSAAHPAFTIEPPREDAGASAPRGAPGEGGAAVREGGAATAWAFFVMGLAHILGGADHLAFLFGVVLLRARVKELVAVVTAFTVAHSITLAVAVLGWMAPSPRLVEPAIALSIAYVGVENFLVKDARSRWRITLPFGLIHGFGFAGALRDLQLPRAQVPAALVTFNLGVEAGQLVAMSLMVPLLLVVRCSARIEPYAVRVLSGALALAGAVWFVLRVANG